MPAFEALALLFDGALSVGNHARAAILLAIPSGVGRLVTLSKRLKLTLKLADVALQLVAISLKRRVVAALALAVEATERVSAAPHAIAVLGDASAALADLVDCAANLAGAEVCGLVASRLRCNLRLRGRLDHRHHLDLVKLIGEETDAVCALRPNGDPQDRGVLRADAVQVVWHIPKAQAIGLQRGVVKPLRQHVIGAAQVLARILGGCLGREAAIFAKLKGFLNVVGVSLGGHRGLPFSCWGGGAVRPPPC